MSAVMPRNRDCEAVQRRCQPLLLGIALMYLSVLGAVYGAYRSGMVLSLVSFSSLLVGAMLGTFMLYSLCADGKKTAAWMTALFAPVIVALFGLQVETLLSLLFGTA